MSDLDEQCRYLAAAYPELGWEDTCAEHRHEERVFSLAVEMARAFQGDTSDEKVGWFMNDADAVVDDFDPTPESWEVVSLGYPKREPGLCHILTVNGVEYVIQDSDWEPMPPVKRATWEEWARDEEDGAES